jgi:hypothetical protein
VRRFVVNKRQSAIQPIGHRSVEAHFQSVSTLLWLFADCQLLTAKFSKIIPRLHPGVLPEYSEFLLANQ